MRRIIRFAGLVVVFVLLLGLAAGRGLRARPTDDERLLAGDVLISFKENPNSAAHDVQGEVLFDAPPTLVWWVLTDYGNWAKIFPDMTTCEVVERKDNVVRLKVWVNNLWPYPDFNYVLAVTEDPVNWSVSWQMETGDLKNFYGSASIKYFSLDTAKTHLTYLINRNQGWYIPRANADLDNRTMVINRLMALRQEVRARKKALEPAPDPNLKPKWWKEPLGWEKDKPEAKEKPAEEKKKKQP